MLISKGMKEKVCTFSLHPLWVGTVLRSVCTGGQTAALQTLQQGKHPLGAPCCHYLKLGLVGATNIHHRVVDTVSSQLVVPVLSTHHESEHKYTLEYVSVMYKGLCNFLNAYLYAFECLISLPLFIGVRWEI